MTAKKPAGELKKYLAELERLKEKKRVLEENEQRHITKAKPKKAQAKPKPQKSKPVKKPVAKKPTPSSPAAKKPTSSSAAKKPVAKKVVAKKPPAKKLKKIPKRMIRKPKPVVPDVKTPEEEAEEEEITDEEIANFQVGKTNMEQLIIRVCEILAKNQSEGVPQSEVWRRLKLSVRDGFRLALKLEWLGIITREKVLEKGRWTHKLLLKRTPISTRSIIAAPCLTCDVEQKCTPDGEISPYTCELIRDWVILDAKGPKKKK